MTAEQYNRMAAPLRARPALVAALRGVNSALTLVGYVTYPLLLILLAVHGDFALLARCILVPGIMFAAVTAARKVYNAPRPYEVLAIDPLIVKDTRGCSFPSRHAFSLFMIGFCWLSALPAAGVVLLVLAVMLAAVRVLGGVHFPSDVIAGALIAFVAWLVGFCLL